MQIGKGIILLNPQKFAGALRNITDAGCASLYQPLSVIAPLMPGSKNAGRGGDG